MNKARRTELQKALDILNALDLEEATQIVADAQEEERESFDNLSDGLQQSEGGQRIEENANKLDEAKDALEEAHNSIIDALAAIEEAME